MQKMIGKWIATTIVAAFYLLGPNSEAFAASPLHHDMSRSGRAITAPWKQGIRNIKRVSKRSPELFASKKQVQVRAGLPLSAGKNISSGLHKDQLHLSPMIGASQIASGVFASRFFSQDGSSSSAQFMDRLFVSLDRQTIGTTQLAKNIASNLKPQSIATLVYFGDTYRRYLSGFPSQEAVKVETESLVEKTLTAILDEKESKSEGPSFHSSLELAKAQKTELEEEALELRRQMGSKNKGIADCKMYLHKLTDQLESAKIGQEAESQARELLSERKRLMRDDIKEIKAKLKRIDRKLYKMQPIHGDLEIALKGFICLYFEAIADESDPASQYSSFQSIQALQSFLWLNAKDKKDLSYYFSKLSHYGVSFVSQSSLTDSYDFYHKEDADLARDLLEDPNLDARLLWKHYDLLCFYLYSSGANLNFNVFGFASVSIYSQEHDETIAFPDCCESTIRNFFNSLIWNSETGDLDLKLLAQLAEKFDLSRDLIDFYESYPSMDMQYRQDARDRFAEILSHLNEKKLANCEPIRYRFADSYELKAGIINTENVLAVLFGRDSFESVVNHLEQLGLIEMNQAQVTDQNACPKEDYGTVEYSTLNHICCMHHSLDHSSFYLERFMALQQGIELDSIYQKIASLYENHSHPSDWILFYGLLQFNSQKEVWNQLIENKSGSEKSIDSLVDLSKHPSMDKKENRISQLASLIALAKQENASRVFYEAIDRLIQRLLAEEQTSINEEDSSIQLKDQLFDMVYPYRKHLESFADLLEKSSGRCLASLFLASDYESLGIISSELLDQEQIYPNLRKFLLSKDRAYIGNFFAELAKTIDTRSLKFMKYVGELESRDPLKDIMISRSLDENPFFFLITRVLRGAY